MAGRLKPLDIERHTKPGKYADGDGLYLIVIGPTSKSWSYRYWKDGKERWHGLGSLKEVSLSHPPNIVANARLSLVQVKSHGLNPR
jgi:Arm DNA-binding domain